jgi:thiamine biosynthesis lipoprotein
MRFPYFISIIFFTFLNCQRATQPPPLLILDGTTMGTVYSVKIVRGEVTQSGLDSLQLKKEIDLILQRINQQMSTYQKDSELSLFNQYRNTDWFPVSPELALIIQKSLQISQLSDGAFDITVGPLVNLWGFGPEERNEIVPADEELKDRIRYVGYQNLHVRNAPPALKKDIPEIYCDLSAIAKGYGVDKLGEYLQRIEIQNYLIDIGGEIQAKGQNQLDKIWKIGVSTPDDKYDIQKVLPLENRSVATSGDYRNYFEKDGIRYSHTIDPRTGKPITHNLASVTVIHDSCMVADGMATAIDVLGPERGYAFAIRLKLSVFLIVREENVYLERMTPEFKSILDLNQRE